MRIHVREVEISQDGHNVPQPGSKSRELRVSTLVVVSVRVCEEIIEESKRFKVEQCRRHLFHESSTQSGNGLGCSTTSTQTISGLDVNIDFDPNEKVGEDFVRNTIVEEFKGDMTTTPFEQGSLEIAISLLDANVRTKDDFDVL
ncbi:transposase [Cucumis melo var. makuwa]|uniref:Transposase n=1 Tax=Cucumis melo var. makuwa TaxID=1194695 RepID=A0A5D3CSF3_CUCMM|nr:transposase [Cucumis melo var. makuwa]TYK14751.1 transposase [Cucumis melo var. makuwa]